MSNESAADDSSSLWQRAKQLISENWSAIRWFLAILAVVIAAALFAIWNAQRAQKFSSEELLGIQKLVVFAGKSAREAQRTQANPLQSLLHVNYALCFINAAKHMVGGIDALQRLATINVVQLVQYLTATQAQLLNKIRQQCADNAMQNQLLPPRMQQQQQQQQQQMSSQEQQQQDEIQLHDQTEQRDDEERDEREK